MDAAWLVPAALGFGLLVGVGGAAAVVAAHARGQRAAAVVTPSVPDGVEEVIDALETAGIVLDSSNNVVSCSTAAVALGLVWNHTLVHQELVSLVDRVRSEGSAANEEMQLPRGPFGDAQVHLLVRAAPLGARFVLVLADDRTEAYRLEDVRRDFVANISHELKTPIGAIGLLAEALESAADEPDEVRRFAKRLTIEAERLRTLTHEIIELSRLQAADALEHAERVNVDSVVAQAVDANRVAAESHRITIVAQADATAVVWGDESMLVTAVHNLIANAIQYSPDGTRVGVGVARRDGAIEIAVTDQGVGIPESERDRVFERFFRVDSARSRQTGGTGLGLAIVKHVVQNHGGDVRVWSQQGRGSTFTIRLPEAAPAAAAPSRGAPS
ncbi:sensor histidine kinase [Protaetiibacter mangrovi]|uniref:Sensor-like histidine kinase SenX3 n=1 Tax=Protaetiibacter mangrovi TaxID=2970926 RepID=A0ABT1ZDL6_9MICO|nr:ATP-binding protein [Protaetiibacter mangrovi]MCS0498795.1 ATP-binding protein [Protaetiibacter mangrovi]TPX05140.1 two-component sensor histidine kinase [Schumannella luteola]